MVQDEHGHGGDKAFEPHIVRRVFLLHLAVGCDQKFTIHTGCPPKPNLRVRIHRVRQLVFADFLRLLYLGKVECELEVHFAHAGAPAGAGEFDER